jgi:tetratricopeptide (TPR) repeat protein
LSLGEPEEGIHHCTEAIARLTPPALRFWLGLAHAIRAGSCYLRGNFDTALSDLAVADALGRETGEYRLQSTAAWYRQVILAALGDRDAALAAVRHGRAVSRDIVGDSLAVGFMGSILLEVGAPADAVETLEAWAAERQRFCLGHPATRFTAALAEAHLALGNVDRAGACADRAAAMEREFPSAWSRGVTRRAQGRVALARGDLAAADATLDEAARTLATVGLPHEVGRLHLLRAEVALARGDRPAAFVRCAEGRRILLGLDRAAERQRVQSTAYRLDLHGLEEVRAD